MVKHNKHKLTAKIKDLSNDYLPQSGLDSESIDTTTSSTNLHQNNSPHSSQNSNSGTDFSLQPTFAERFNEYFPVGIASLVFATLAWLDYQLQPYLGMFYLASLAYLGCIFWAYLYSRPCRTQSWLLRKCFGVAGFYYLAMIAFTSSTFGGFGIYQFHYLLMLLFSGLMFFSSDPRQKYLDGSQEYQQAWQKYKSFAWKISGVFLGVGLIIGLYFLLGIPRRGQVEFNPFLQFALGINLAVMTLTLLKSRLDVYKAWLTILEVIGLLLAVIYSIFFYIYANLTLSEMQLYMLVGSYFFIAICCLTYNFMQTYKSALGFIIKLLPIMGYFFITFTWGLVNHH